MANNTIRQEPMLTLMQVAHWLNMSKRQVVASLECGEIPYIKGASGEYRFDPVAIRERMQTNAESAASNNENLSFIIKNYHTHFRDERDLIQPVK